MKTGGRLELVELQGQAGDSVKTDEVLQKPSKDAAKGLARLDPEEKKRGWWGGARRCYGVQIAGSSKLVNRTPRTGIGYR